MKRFVPEMNCDPEEVALGSASQASCPHALTQLSLHSGAGQA